MFLVKVDHQTGGLQTEVEDESWDALCEATRDWMDPLAEATIVEAHQWVGALTSSKAASVIQDTFERIATQGSNPPVYLGQDSQ